MNEDNNNTKKTIDRNTLLFIGVIVILLILILIKFIIANVNSSEICAKDNCNNESAYGSIYCEEHKSKGNTSVSSNNSIQTYSDDVITLTYNSDTTLVQKLDSPNMSYSLIVLNSNKTFNDTSLYDNSVVYITEIDTPEHTFEYYDDSTLVAFKILFTAFVNASLTTEEITVNDVQGDTSGQLTTLIRCEKTLSDGRNVKAKLLHIDENKLLFVFFSMLPNEEQSVTDEFTAVYDSIRYNNNTSIVNKETTIAPTTEVTTETTTTQIINEASNQIGILNLKESPNTSARVDEIARQAKNDALYIDDSITLEAINYIKDNYPNYFTNNDVMEQTMYYGYLLEYAYNNTNDLYAELGMDTYQAVKYVYRGAESINDTSTRSNLEQIAKSLVYFK